MLFHLAVALCCSLLSSLITGILYPTLPPKNLSSLSIPACLHMVEVEWREKDCLAARAYEASVYEKQRLVRTADLFPVCGNGGGRRLGPSHSYQTR